MNLIKRSSSFIFACLVAFAFPIGVLSGVTYYQDDSEKQESVIDFDKPVFEVIFPIEPIYCNRTIEPDSPKSSVLDDEQEQNVVVNNTECEQYLDEQYVAEEYDESDDSSYFEYYEDEEYVYEESEEVVDEYDDYNSEEYDFDFVGEEQQSIIPSEQFQEDGVEFWNGYYWTYYSELALPGEDLDIPGRYTDHDGYVCDENNYICLASDSLPRGTVVSTPFGKDGKVYDCGCGNDYVLDVYCSW